MTMRMASVAPLLSGSPNRLAKLCAWGMKVLQRQPKAMRSKSRRKRVAVVEERAKNHLSETGCR